MTLRTPRERLVQTLCFELGGLAVVTPAYMMIFGQGTAESFALMLSLSIAVMVWSTLYNAGFDWAEYRWTGRVASDRSHRMRLIHAALHEATSAIVTVPLIMRISDLGFGAALALDLGLTLFYATYAYLFHLIFDHVRPVKPAAMVRQRPAI
jgi:uncharacterized membrane protein